jgi:hypothetical protein
MLRVITIGSKRAYHLRPTPSFELRPLFSKIHDTFCVGTWPGCNIVSDLAVSYRAPLNSVVKRRMVPVALTICTLKFTHIGQLSKID